MTVAQVPDSNLRGEINPRQMIPVLMLFFVSGLLALVYEVLWMKQLSLLFGNTAHSAATTLAAFFLGLALGGYYWGQRAATLEKPLQIYGLLELAIALSVVGGWQILDGYQSIYPWLFENFSEKGWAFVLAKFLLSLLLVFPSSFFIGGTLPVITQCTTRDMRAVGPKTSMLYAVNTLGAAAGAVLAGFFLPRLFGYALSGWLAVGSSALVGVVALSLAYCWRAINVTDPEPEEPTQTSGRADLAFSGIQWLCFLSGFGTLGLQVLWTRMFAQVLQNSVYTFATILVVFLCCLSTGAFAANRIMQRGFRPPVVLFWVFTAGALAIATTPFFFYSWTDGLHYIGAQKDWNDYLLQALAMEFAVMAVPLILLGIIFPYLIKTAQTNETCAGRLVGRLIAYNTFGAIAGSLAAGFVLLDLLGLWGGIRLIAVFYLLVGFYLTNSGLTLHRIAFPVSAAAVLLVMTIFDATRLPLVKINPVDNQESLLQAWESSSGIVAVVRDSDSLTLQLNNYYTLGGTQSRDLEVIEGCLPMRLHPDAKSVFFLGLGTGISAGAVLRHPIQSLLVAELVPDVIRASRKYFAEYNNRLFFDTRARVIAEDGRNFLAASPRKFDVIISDLFVPWRSGIGSLYSQDHYRNVRDSLASNGLFMQWLPAYQVSSQEFGTIVRTLSSVFPQITLWRGGFSSTTPVFGLLAQTQKTPLVQAALDTGRNNWCDSAGHEPLPAYYIGNIGRSAAEYSGYPINSEDHPVIEFQAPITQRKQKMKQTDWITNDQLLRTMVSIQHRQPLHRDPFLEHASTDILSQARAGMALHRSQIFHQQGRLSAAKEAYTRYQRLLNKNFE